jgi:hypothetical protein
MTQQSGLRYSSCLAPYPSPSFCPYRACLPPTLAAPPTCSDGLGYVLDTQWPALGADTQRLRHRREGLASMLRPSQILCLSCRTERTLWSCGFLRFLSLGTVRGPFGKDILSFSQSIIGTMKVRFRTSPSLVAMEI